MAKFKKGQKVIRNRDECYYIDGKVVEFVDDKGEIGWDRDLAIPDDYTSIGNNTYHYAYDEELELITDYQPITPKVGERYRVLKQYGGTKPGNEYKCTSVSPNMLGIEHGEISTEYLTTEYLELVEEEQHTGAALTVTQTNVNDVMNQAIRAMDMASKPLFVTGRQLGKGMVEEHLKLQKTLNKTKQTTMQKLTSALKRVLSADKQTLYKANKIAHDLELTREGQANYVDALFNNEGDHKKAVAEMVAMAQAELDEA